MGSFQSSLKPFPVSGWTEEKTAWVSMYVTPDTRDTQSLLRHLRSLQQYHWCPHGKAAGQNSASLSTAPWIQAPGKQTPPSTANLLASGGFCLLQEGVSRHCRGLLPPGTATRLRLGQLRHLAPSPSPAATALNLFCRCRPAAGEGTALLPPEVTSLQPSSQIKSSHSHGSFHLPPRRARGLAAQESRLLFLQWLGPVRTLPTCFSSPLMLCQVPPSSHSSLT